MIKRVAKKNSMIKRAQSHRIPPPTTIIRKKKPPPPGTCLHTSLSDGLWISICPSLLTAQLHLCPVGVTKKAQHEVQLFRLTAHFGGRLRIPGFHCTIRRLPFPWRWPSPTPPPPLAGYIPFRRGPVPRSFPLPSYPIHGCFSTLFCRHLPLVRLLDFFFVVAKLGVRSHLVSAASAINRPCLCAPLAPLVCQGML
jgi:hypothetical protein